jgi:NNP family nitrate/nitrite transporter-like MFS transporter
MMLAYKSATPEEYFMIFMVLFVVLFAADWVTAPPSAPWA